MLVGVEHAHLRAAGVYRLIRDAVQVVVDRNLHPVDFAVTIEVQRGFGGLFVGADFGRGVADNDAIGVELFVINRLYARGREGVGDHLVGLAILVVVDFGNGGYRLDVARAGVLLAGKVVHLNAG